MAPGENNVKTGAKRTEAERLHHWLHLIAESDERSVATVLVDLVAETLGTDAAGRLLDALEMQAEAAKSSHDGGLQ